MIIVNHNIYFVRLSAYSHLIGQIIECM